MAGCGWLSDRPLLTVWMFALAVALRRHHCRLMDAAVGWEEAPRGSPARGLPTVWHPTAPSFLHQREVGPWLPHGRRVELRSILSRLDVFMADKTGVCCGISVDRRLLTFALRRPAAILVVLLALAIVLYALLGAESQSSLPL